MIFLVAAALITQQFVKSSVAFVLHFEMIGGRHAFEKVLDAYEQLLFHNGPSRSRRRDIVSSKERVVLVKSAEAVEEIHRVGQTLVKVTYRLLRMLRSKLP